MIDRQFDKLVIECDSCDETFSIDSEDFAETWTAAKREGWRAKKIGDEWVHGCARCGV